MFKWSQKAGISNIAAFISVFCAFKWCQKAAISDIAANASIKWPDRVKPRKNGQKCWSGHFIETLPGPLRTANAQRMPL